MCRREWTTLRFMSGMCALLATASTWAGSLVFVPSFVAPAGNYPTGVVTADFNQDGKLDVAVAHDANPTLSVLLASQNGEFGPAVSYSTDNVNEQGIAQSLVAADFNGDGILDLASPNQYGGPFHVSVLLGNRDGTFQAQTLFQVGICPVAIATADLNGDGKADLVTADFEGTSISVLLGHGDGTFAAAVDYAVGSFPTSVAVGDFNGDQIPDLLVANSNSSSVSLLLGKGGGTFNSAISIATTYEPRSVAVADLNNDGKLDAVIANGYVVSVLLGHGDGTFASAVNYPAGTMAYPNAIALADFDGDGYLDIVAANSSSLTILSGLANGTFSAPITIPSISGASGVAVADLNGDGKLDLAVTNGSSTVTVLLNDVLFSSGFEAR